MARFFSRHCGVERRKKRIVVLVSLAFFIFTGVPLFGQVTLPQEHPYQVTLRDWMAGLTESDFDMTLAPFQWSSNDYNGDLEQLYRQWIVLRRFDIVAFPRNTQIIRVPSRHFVLDNGNGEGIEGSGEIRYFRDPAFAAFWSQFDLPGNPHFNSQPLKLRAAVMAAVDLMMLDHDLNNPPQRSDFLGGSLRPWIYVYMHTKNVLPVNVQQAFEDGLLRMVENLENWGPTDINTNMDTRAVASAAYLYRAFQDPIIQDRAVNLAKTFLFGDPNGTPDSSDGGPGAIFHSAGYVGEQDGPETTYNGISLYYLTEAAMVSRGEAQWDAFMPEVIRRMSSFKAYQAFGDPDGYYDGPSNYAKRTSDSYVYDQHGHYWRDLSCAMLTDEAKYLVLGIKGRSDQGIFGEQEMAAAINRSVQQINNNGQFGVLDTTAVPLQWTENHWPDDWPFSWEYYVDNAYSLFSSLNSSQDSIMVPPFDRTGNINRSFENEFWAYKADDGNQDFGWFIESVSDPGGGYPNGYLGGGSLAEFWSGNTGTVIRGKRRGNNASVNDTWNNVETWATNHLWGVDNAGNPFSSARNRSNQVIYDIHQSIPFVCVSGTLRSSNLELTAMATYRRCFTKAAHGLTITATLTSDGSDMVTELWESLPVFLRDELKQNDDATIEFRLNNDWQTLTTTPISTDILRIGRFGNYVYIQFPQPRTVKLSTQVWTTDDQTDNRIRNIHFDLLNNNGIPVPMPDSVTIAYTISTTADNPVYIGDGEFSGPVKFQLFQNFPNPFNPVTTIRFSLPHNTHVKLKIFDILGRQVAKVIDGDLSAGSHSVVFEAGNLASGIYLYRLETPGFTGEKLMEIIK